MHSFLSYLIFLSNLNSFVINLNDSIITILSGNNNFGILISWRNFDTFCFFEAELSRLVIIYNCNSSSGILSTDFIFRIDIIKLNEEVLIRFPLIIINDSNFEILCIFTLGECDKIVEWHIIFISFSISVNSLN